MPKLYENNIDELVPNDTNTQIKEGRCPACTFRTSEILESINKVKSHDDHQLFIIQRNGMKNCRCPHRFNMIICTCFQCNDDYLGKTKVISQLLNFVDYDKLQEYE